MSELGEISEESVTKEWSWSIKDFSSLPVTDDTFYESPRLTFSNEYWCFQILPNGRKMHQSEGYIGLFLKKIISFRFGPPMKIDVTLGLKTVDGELGFEQRAVYNMSWGLGLHHFLSRTELFERKSDLLPSDTLTLVCRMKHAERTEVASLSKTIATKCSYCNEVLCAEEDISSHLRKCEDLPIKCRKCDDEVALKNLYNHKCLVAETEDDGSLCQDFKKMLLDGINYDLTLKVKDKELRAHQDVLRARSRVFQSMLSHDMIEKNRGVIDIPDCDPKAMELFLLYVYSGKVETLDPTNMLGLYYIADKYDMRDLKEKCCNFIKDSLSHTNICKVIQLALNHSDTNLLEYATEYFTGNTYDILLTVEWQTFQKENQTVSNELLIKTFRKIKDSEN